LHPRVGLFDAQSAAARDGAERDDRAGQNWLDHDRNPTAPHNHYFKVSVTDA